MSTKLECCYRAMKYRSSAYALFHLLPHKHLAAIREPEENDGEGELLVQWEKPAGRPLRDFIREHRREVAGGHACSEAEALRIVGEVAQALAHLHAHRILHRDVRPESIYITVEGHAVLAGFTEFCVMEEEQRCGVTDHGYDLYRPPELLKDENPAADGKGDIWCLGCVLYEMIMPEHPYQGATVIQTVKNVKSGRYTELPSGKYSGETRDFLHRMLRINPAERPSACVVVDFCADGAVG